MRTEQLQYLIIIKQTGSLHTASEQLHMTPSALSQSIRAMESELALQLLFRSNKGVQLTEEGLRLVELAVPFLDGLSELKGAYNKIDHLSEGKLEFYTGQSAVDNYLTKMVVDFCNTHPEVAVNPIVEELSASLQCLLYDETRQFVLCYDLFALDNHYGYDDALFEFSTLSTGKQYAVMSRKLALSKYKIITPYILGKYPILLYRSKSFDTSILKEKEKYGEDAKIIILDNQSVYNDMIKEGLGVGIALRMPLDLPEESDIVYVPFDKEKRIYNFGYITKRHMSLNRLSQLFLNYMTNYIRKHTIVDNVTALMHEDIDKE